jgi:hypothetical protein
MLSLYNKMRSHFDEYQKKISLFVVKRPPKMRSYLLKELLFPQQFYTVEGHLLADPVSNPDRPTELRANRDRLPRYRLLSMHNTRQNPADFDLKKCSLSLQTGEQCLPGERLNIFV